MTVGRIHLSTQQASDPWSALDAIRKCVSVDPQPPNSFTVDEYAKRYGMQKWTAERQLRQLVDSGALCSRQAVIDNRRRNVYWIAEVQPCPEPTSTSGPTGKKKARISG